MFGDNDTPILITLNSDEEKNKALRIIAELLKGKEGYIIEKNKIDINSASERKGIETFIDRLI